MVTTVRASRDDLVAIATLLVRTWQVSYKGIFPESFLNSLSVSSQIRRHELYFDKGIHYFAAKDDDGELIGFASYGPSRNPRMQSDLELYTLYVDVDHQRKGVGRALFDSVEKDILEGQSLGVSVFQNNPFQGFYRKHGFEVIGEETVVLGDVQEMAFIMRRYVC